MDPKFFALLAAIMHVLLREKPELRQEILELAKVYEADEFLPGRQTYGSMRQALARITEKESV